MNGEYVIVGDTEKYKDCLVCVAGRIYEKAEEILNRMLNNPTENDKRLMVGHKNLRIEFVEERYCWWNYCCD
jgi:hypothetical protein